MSLRLSKAAGAILDDAEVQGLEFLKTFFFVFQASSFQSFQNCVFSLRFQLFARILKATHSCAPQWHGSSLCSCSCRCCQDVDKDDFFHKSGPFVISHTAKAGGKDGLTLRRCILFQGALSFGPG